MVMCSCRHVRWHDVQGGLKSFLAPDTVSLGHSFVVSESMGCPAVPATWDLCWGCPDPPTFPQPNY
jgi:hypothetical protein